MKRALLCLAVLLSMSSAQAANDIFGGIKFLDGYSIKQGSAIDATVWTIEKQGGLKISFESGFSEGLLADPSQREKYSWYRTQEINGTEAVFALVKPGLKTVWEPE